MKKINISVLLSVHVTGLDKYQGFDLIRYLKIGTCRKITKITTKEKNLNGYIKIFFTRNGTYKYSTFIYTLEESDSVLKDLRFYFSVRLSLGFL